MNTDPHLIVDHLPATRPYLRIAVVTETYPPEVNGVALTLARMIEGLRERNHDVQLVRPRQPRVDVRAEPGLHEVLMRGLPIPRYPNLRMGVPARKPLVRLWSTARPDIVHVATEGPLGWSALNAALSLRIPVTSDFRTNFHAYSGHYGVGWLRRPIMAYLRKFHNRCLATTVPTEDLLQDLKASGFRNLSLMPRGVDTGLFSPRRRDNGLRASWRASPGQPVICHVGRLAPEKNLDLLVDTWRAVSADVPGARLLVVGDGPSRAALEHGCPGAIFVGQRTGADLAAHYASSDMFLFPSLTETFGNVTLEALASGLPVVAFNYAAARQVMTDGVEGALVRRGDSEAFKRCALTLARQTTLRQAMGAEARATAERLGWAQIIDRFEATLQTLARSPCRDEVILGQSPLSHPA